MQDREGELLIKCYDTLYDKKRDPKKFQLRYNWFTTKKVARKILFNDLNGTKNYGYVHEIKLYYSF